MHVFFVRSSRLARTEEDDGGRGVTVERAGAIVAEAGRAELLGRGLAGLPGALDNAVADVVDGVGRRGEVGGVALFTLIYYAA